MLASTRQIEQGNTGLKFSRKKIQIGRRRRRLPSCAGGPVDLVTTTAVGHRAGAS